MHDDIFVTTHSAVVLGLPRNSALLCTEGMVLINEHLSCFHFPPIIFHCVTLCLTIQIRIWGWSCYFPLWRFCRTHHYSISVLQMLIDFHNTLPRWSIIINQGNGAQGDWGQKYCSVGTPRLRHLWPGLLIFLKYSPTTLEFLYLQL